MRKATWLYFSGVARSDVRPPLVLHPGNGDRRAEQLMSHRQRSETVPAFAEWLIEIARLAKVETGCSLSQARIQTGCGLSGGVAL